MSRDVDSFPCSKGIFLTAHISEGKINSYWELLVIPQYFFFREEFNKGIIKFFFLSFVDKF